MTTKAVNLFRWGAKQASQEVLASLSKNLDIPLNKPTLITLEVTPNCFLRCRQCDIWKIPKQPSLSFKNAQVIIDKLYAWLGKFYLSFTGGEPFMNPALPRMIGYAERKGIVTHVNSNGVLIKSELAKEIVASNLSAFTISLDGAQAKTHDHLRGVAGTFTGALRAIRLLKKLRRGGKPIIYVNTVIMKQNLKELEKLVDLVETEGVDGISFQPLMPNEIFGPQAYRKDWEKRNPLWSASQDARGVLERLRQLSHQKNFIKNASDTEWQTLQAYFQNPRSANNIQCPVGVKNFLVDAQGNVRLCFSFPKIGNIFASQPENIWTSPVAQKQRKTIRRCTQPCKLLYCNRKRTLRQSWVSFGKIVRASLHRS